MVALVAGVVAVAAEVEVAMGTAEAAGALVVTSGATSGDRDRRNSHSSRTMT